jgi:hypothetical protein
VCALPLGRRGDDSKVYLVSPILLQTRSCTSQIGRAIFFLEFQWASGPGRVGGVHAEVNFPGLPILGDLGEEGGDEA